MLVVDERIGMIIIIIIIITIIILCFGFFPPSPIVFFCVYVCFAVTQIACQFHQERTQVVCGNKEVRKRLARIERHSRKTHGIFHIYVLPPHR